MKDTMIGVDLAKNVFQLHGASMTGEVKFCKKLTRAQFMAFMGLVAQITLSTDRALPETDFRRSVRN
jgi:hypothetical protein